MSFRSTILLFIVFIVLGGYIAYKQITKEEEKYVSPPEVWSVKEEGIKAITVSLPKEGKRSDFILGKDDYWHLNKDGLPKVDLKRWGGIVLLVTGPESRRLISETIDDLAEYGLDEPQMVVSLTVDGLKEQLEIHIGDATPNQDAYFVKLKAHKKLYTIDKSWFYVIKRLAVEPPKPKFREVLRPKKQNPET